jgi:GDP-D-mannose 3',5'-epimerase
MNSPKVMIDDMLQRLSVAGIDPGWYAGKRILVTGGAGFIGSWLVEALVQLGAEVFVVDNLWRGSLDNLKKSETEDLIPLETHFFLGDLQEYHFALTACLRAQPDLVFHLADIVAGIDFVFANQAFLFRANLLINSNLFAAVRESGVQKLVYPGTACSYPKHLQGQPGGLPLVEEQMYPAAPESAYGWSKLMGEYEAGLLAENSALQVGVIRFQNVYGPRSIFSKKRSQVIPSLIRKAIRHPEEDFLVWGSGSQTRDFVFIGDVIDALLRVPLRGMDCGPLNIGTAQETSIAELASQIIKISGKPIEIKFDREKPDGDGGRSGNCQKAQTLLGWTPSTTLADGLQQTYAWADEKIRQHAIDLEK